jgi:hypothetical protein
MAVVEVGDEPVAQYVEADLVDGHVHDVVGVGRAALGLLGRLAQPPDGDAELGEQRAHPLGVAAGEVVVHGDHVHAAALPGVARGGDRPDQRLALAGDHLDDVAEQEGGRRLQLDVERALAERLLRRLAGHGEERGDLAVAPGALRGYGAGLLAAAAAAMRRARRRSADPGRCRNRRTNPRTPRAGPCFRLMPPKLLAGARRGSVHPPALGEQADQQRHERHQEDLAQQGFQGGEQSADVGRGREVAVAHRGDRRQAEVHERHRGLRAAEEAAGQDSSTERKTNWNATGISR